MLYKDRRENVVFILELLYRQGIVNIHYTGKENEFQFWFNMDLKDADSTLCSGIVRCGLSGYDLLLQPKGWEKADQGAKDLAIMWNKRMAATMSYPPHFFLWDTGLWLTASISCGKRLEYRFTTALLQLIRILQKQFTATLP